MRKIKALFALTAILSTPSLFADDMQNLSSDSKPCVTIARACLKADFSRKENTDKQFWQDCMKPIILGQTVKDVTVDAATVKACRTNKIAELQKELKEFEKASAKQSS